MSAKKDLTGQKFGRLTVAEDTGERKNGYVIWRCVCECGKETVANGWSLKSGNTKSCGCLHDELATERIKNARPPRIKHGKSDTRLFRIWAGMKARCYGTNHKDYAHYGGRGIKICSEWLQDFSVFYEWAVENGYSDSLTIDREDVDGDYCPDNCRWATRAEQSRNQRRHKHKSAG